MSASNFHKNLFLCGRNPSQGPLKLYPRVKCVDLQSKWKSYWNTSRDAAFKCAISQQQCSRVLWLHFISTLELLRKKKKKIYCSNQQACNLRSVLGSEEVNNSLNKAASEHIRKSKRALICVMSKHNSWWADEFWFYQKDLNQTSTASSASLAPDRERRGHWHKHIH